MALAATTCTNLSFTSKRKRTAGRRRAVTQRNPFHPGVAVVIKHIAFGVTWAIIKELNSSKISALTTKSGITWLILEARPDWCSCWGQTKVRKAGKTRGCLRRGQLTLWNLLGKNTLCDRALRKPFLIDVVGPSKSFFFMRSWRVEYQSISSFTSIISKPKKSTH